jgi:hypothetical protein
LTSFIALFDFDFLCGTHPNKLKRKPKKRGVKRRQKKYALNKKLVFLRRVLIFDKLFLKIII